MFSKDQRKVLNSLSKEVFGSESRWRKMIKDPKFRIVESSVEDTSSPKYVQFKRNAFDGRPGTVWSFDKAVSAGKISGDTPVQGPRITKTREPSYDELVIALTSNLDMLLLSRLNKEQQAMVFAKRLVDGNLLYAVSLVLGSNTKEDFDSLVATSPEGLRETLNKMLVDNDTNTSNSTVFDAVTFVSNVVFAASHADRCAEEVSLIMETAKVEKKEQEEKARKTLAFQRLAR